MLPNRPGREGKGSLNEGCECNDRMVMSPAKVLRVSGVTSCACHVAMMGSQ